MPRDCGRERSAPRERQRKGPQSRRGSVSRRESIMSLTDDGYNQASFAFGFGEMGVIDDLLQERSQQVLGIKIILE